ncbi:two-partner secretion domain-containing protein [Quatrionicoccus australiensis]|uniref:two-partner secretion domain-containing protein n=1 Tax=Quatrionicoccus australiensis TaxID=138118 RepID=UPI001CF7F066|nr:DUF637 domain-containing protein [Quatrionicoccus australiensis]UCV14765.1 DUF637 domain-containing protein [Quatrionicoccus australiensis]
MADATAIASQRPTISSTAAGTPLINITAPNAAGLSYNRYQRFDVDSTGAILNNSLVSGSNSMGIQIGANSNFAGKSATAIINEVVTALPSQLSGPLAIFGDKARIIVVNPNGITCDGCSFINTSGVTLTTGQVQFLNAPGGTATSFDNATALSFVVNGGQIRVTGNGLASPLARLDLIAQTLKLEGPTNVGSGSLNLIAGRNTVDADTLAILAQGSGNDAATQGGRLAIDASLLGAMTAGKILIVSTAAGLGVRSATNLAASSGDLRISANGDLSLARADAAGNINLSAVGTLSHTGISAQGNADLAAAVLNNQNQTIVAQGNVRLVAPALNNLGGQILAGGTLNVSAPGGDFNLSDGTLYGTKGLTVAARNLSNSGNFSHSPSVTLVADNSVNNTGSFLVGGDLDITASTLSNAGTLGSFGAFKAALSNLLNQGTLQSDGVLDIRAVNLDNQSGAQLVGGGNSRILLSGALANAGTLASTGALEVAADSLNHSGRTEAQGDLQLSIAGAASNSGQMQAGAKFDGSFGSLINSGTLQAGTDASFNLGAASDNTGGQLLAIQDLSLTTTHSGDLGGTIGANRDVTLNFGSYTHNGATTFLAGRDLTVNATNFTNNAVMEAWQNLNFNVTGTLANSGQMLAGQDITLKAGTLINTSGFVEATRDLNIEADTVINTRLPVTTEHTNWGDNAPAESVNCRSDHGYCESWKQVEAGPAAVLWAGRNLNAKVSGTLTNDASLIAAVGDVSITADTFNNTARTLTTTWHGHWKEWKGSLWGYKDHDDYGITVTGNTSADVNAGGTLTVTAPNQTNTGNLLGNTIALAGTHLTNGLTDPNLQTPASTVPSTELSLGVPGVNGKSVPASVKFTPTGTSYFTTTSRLAMLVPGLDINSLLPESLRNTASPFLMDAWLEQQAIRQAALSETGRASFLAMNDPAGERAVLLQAGARFAQANGIHLGVALSAEQVAKLDSPILWYVSENFTGPDGKTYSALVPKVYLPDASRMALANVAGGTIQGGTVSLTGETVRNTGFIVADGKLSMTTENLTNEKRSADLNNGGQAMRQYVGTQGYWKITGTTVQPGGFISAAELDLSAKAINSISGEFIEKNQDIGVKLAAAMGNGFTLKEAKDDIHQDYKQLSKPNALGQVVVLVIVVVVSIYTAGAASAAIASAAQSSALASGLSLSAAAQVGAAAASSTMAVATSAAIGGMAGSATSQLLTTGKLDAGQMFKAGLTSGLTAGITNGLGLDKLDGLSNTASGPVATGASATNWGVKAMGWAARAGVSAGVSTAINGGSFKTAFVNNFVANGAASIANTIGDLKQDGTINEVQRVAAHAVLGCAAQAASGGQCAGGAIGAMASSIAGNFVDDPKTLFDKALIIGGLSGLGGLAAIAAGKDGVSGFNAGKNEVQNNRLLHPKEIEKIKELAKAYAAKYQLSLADAEAQLTAQALRDTDKEYHDAHAQENLNAEKFLRSNATSFVDEQGRKILMFANSGYYNDSSMYANTRQTYSKEYTTAEQVGKFDQLDRNKQINQDTGGLSKIGPLAVGAGKGAAKATYELVAPAGDLLQTGNAFVGSILTGKPQDFDCLSSLCSLSKQGASTGDLVTGSFDYLLRTPDRAIDAYNKGNYDGTGKEVGSLLPGIVVAIEGGRTGSSGRTTVVEEPPLTSSKTVPEAPKVVEMPSQTPVVVTEVPGQKSATFYGEPVTPSNQSAVFHGTNKQTLGLDGMTNMEAAQHLYENGLNARGTNIELQDHVAGVPDTAFRGTTNQLSSPNKDAGAVYWAGDDGLVIKLKNVPGYDINELRNTSSTGGGLSGYVQGKTTSGELEISVPAKIAPENIEKIYIKTTDPESGRVSLTEVKRQ